MDDDKPHSTQLQYKEISTASQNQTTSTICSHLEQEISDLKRLLLEESSKNSILTNEVLILKQSLGQANIRIGTLERTMSTVRSSFQALLAELTILKKCSDSNPHQCSPTVDNRMTKLGESTELLSQKASNIKKQVDENTSVLAQYDERIHSMSSNLSEVDLRQQILENTNMGGRFIWKIDHLKYRVKQSILGKISSLHSAPCFTSRFGYKFCTYLYLNGDGAGKGTHISLYIVIMKSEYDALLEWPFRQKVTFNLLNHSNINDSMKRSIVPDANSPSFKQPHKEMNVAAGFPLFVSKERLESFVIDDSIFIETSVCDA